MFEQKDAVARTQEVSKTSDTISFDKIMKDFDPKASINTSEAVCSSKKILPDMVIEKCVVPPGPNNIKVPKKDDFEGGKKPQPHCDKGVKDGCNDFIKDTIKEVSKNPEANTAKNKQIFAIVTPGERAYGPR